MWAEGVGFAGWASAMVGERSSRWQVRPVAGGAQRVCRVQRGPVGPYERVTVATLIW
jgi:hypothetical protein